MSERVCRVVLCSLIEVRFPADVLAADVPSFVRSGTARAGDELVVTPPEESFLDDPRGKFGSEVAIHFVLATDACRPIAATSALVHDVLALHPLAAVENDHVIRHAAGCRISDERVKELFQVEGGNRLFFEPGEYGFEDLILADIERDGVCNTFYVSRFGSETIKYRFDARHKI